MPRVTLRNVRESHGYTIEEVSKHCGIPADEYESYENNSGDMTKVVACRIKRLYGIPLDLIYVGLEPKKSTFK